jgi:hypothetical protein
MGQVSNIARLQDMSIVWMDAALRKTWRWTDSIAFLGVVIQAATGCRVGEIVRSPGYSGSGFLAWGEVDLYLRGTTWREEPNCGRH